MTTTEATSQPAPKQRLDPAGVVAVLAASAAWGTSGIFLKFVTLEGDVSALALAFWRDLTSFAVLVIALGILRPAWLRVPRTKLRWLIAMGVSLGIFHVFWNVAVMLNGAAVATVQQAGMPAIVALVAWLLWGEALTWQKIVAILLTFAGTVLVSGLDALGQAQLSLQGLFIGLAVPAMYAAWTLFGKKARGDHNPMTTMTYAFGIAALVLLPLQFFTEQPFPVSGKTLLWFAAFVGIATVPAFPTYTWGLGKLPASVASILAMSEIAFVALYATVLLGERLTALQMVGAGLVIVGVLILSLPGSGGRRETRPPAAAPSA
ncbi:MAG: DMT family transporter [Anaerolineae bacterium]|jgi:drug/metabolite transporter (DMT)-like permease|nr:DMT family transporter [Anaerolineae bacterium]MDX9833084.1 DMT family transporter [Anaerolineae bacterium]